MEQNSPLSPLEMAIQLPLTTWNLQNDRFTKLVDQLTDAQLSAAIAPGKNSGVYLLGHVIAVHDGMMALLGLGERHYAHLDEAFLRNPDNSDLPRPSITELKAALHAVNARLAAGFATLTPSGWLERHTAVSAEDFEKEPHRNKLNLLLSRTTHLAYHLGQLILLK